MSKTIELKRKAGELRQKAQKEWDELAEQVERQLNGEADEDSKLSHSEIKRRREAIQEKFSEAKEIEGLNDLEGLGSRSDDASDGAQDMLRRLNNTLAEAAGNSKDRDDVWKNHVQFLRAIRTKHGNYDHPVKLSDEQRKALNASKRLASLYQKGERLPSKDVSAEEYKTLVGDDDQHTSGGHYLVPPEHLDELLQVMGEEQVFVDQARRVPMARPQVDFPRLVQTDGEDTRPLYSFAAVEKIAEGAEKPEREPKFEQLVLNAIKYAAYTEASDELLVDSIVNLEPVITGGLSRAIGYEYDRDCIRGSGSGEPQGWLDSAATYSQPRQSTGEVNPMDIFNMESRFFGDSGVYMYHPSVIPQLHNLTEANVIVWHPDLTAGSPGSLLGRPLVSTHKLPKLGNAGDINLVDPSFYLVGDLQAVTIATSGDYRFRHDVTAWRATFRGAGTPWPAGTFSHEADGAGEKDYEVSPFIKLGDTPTS